MPLMRKPVLLIVALLAAYPLAGRDADPSSAAMTKVSEMASLVRDNYYKPVSADTLAYAPVKGVLETLDPHSYFIDPESLARMREDYSGKFFGLGIQIQKQDDRLVVVSVLEGTPAARNGLQTGDLITSIGGESTKPLSSFEAMQRLRGARGSKVTITLVREGLDKPFDLTVAREEIPLLSVPYAFMLDGTTGYVYIRNFAENTGTELEQALDKLSKQGMTRLLLDLRGNGGGTLTSSIDVADEFLPEDALVVSMKGRNPSYNRQFRASRSDAYEKLPVVVLINQGTASASEIVSGAIMDHDRGPVVGEDSWGKGLVQTVIPLGSNIGMALTTAKYVTPSGRCVQRDYTHVEDYFLSKRAPDSERQAFFTDHGRRVLGQGGITPDVKVSDTLKPLTGRLILNGTFFSYARKYAAAGTPKPGQDAASASASSGPAVARPAGTDDLGVDDAMLDDFQAFLKSRKIEYAAKDFDDAREEIRHELVREVNAAAWGLEDGLRAYRRLDPVVLKGLEMMPEAERMAAAPPVAK